MSRINPGCSHPYLPEYFLSGNNGLDTDTIRLWFGKLGLVGQSANRRKALSDATTKVKDAFDHGVMPSDYAAWEKTYNSGGGWVDEWKGKWCKLFDRHPHLQPTERALFIQQQDGTYIPFVVVNAGGRWRRLNATEAKLMVADPSRQVDPTTPRPEEGVAYPEQFLVVDKALPARKESAPRQQTYRPPARPRPPAPQGSPWKVLAIGLPLTLAGAGGVWWAVKKFK